MDYSDFLLKEYQNISEAHFKTNEMISAFFRYSIVVMTIPLTIVAALVSSESGMVQQISADWRWLFAVGYVFAVFSVVGYGMSRYLTALRFEALLYARVVNSIRDWFCKSGETHNIELAVEVLPRDATVPSSKKEGDHAYLVRSFAFLSSLYILVSLLCFLTALIVLAEGAPRSLNAGECLILGALLIAFVRWFSWSHKRYLEKRESRDIE